jgi:hypothetical protein
LESYRGEDPPLAWNAQVPHLITTSGWFEFSPGARCEYGFAVTNTTTRDSTELRIPCRYRTDGERLAVQVGEELHSDLNGRWTAERVTLTNPLGEKLVYSRP